VWIKSIPAELAKDANALAGRAKRLLIGQRIRRHFIRLGAGGLGGQGEGQELVAAQNCVDELKGDVATVTRALGRMRNPAIVVCHCPAERRSQPR
jgi:hypothetical protein